MKPAFRLGFTVIELLCVAATIALLAALLLPVLSRAKDRARSVQCISNLRQWAFAFRQYADDYQDSLPRCGQGVKPLEEISRSEDWFNALPPYLKLPSYQQLTANHQRLNQHQRSAFVCPAAIDPGSNHFLPYAMNMNLCPWGNSGNTPATKFSEVVQPTRVVSLADAPGPYSATFPSSNPYSPSPRHQQYLNILFLAGTVQTFKREYVGCGAGDPRHEEIRWLTGTDSDASVGKY